jgi:hypothetical protein
MQKLSSGASCELEIDATAGIARVIFNFQSAGLGILEYPNYDSGDIITFSSGNNILTLYNALEKGGSVNFDISYSGASKMFFGVGSAIATLLAVF